MAKNSAPVVEQDGYYVVKRAIATLDGEPIPGAIVSGPHATKQEAVGNCGDSECVWRFESL